MPRCTTNSIRSAISSRGKSTSRDALLPWPSGAPSRHRSPLRDNRRAACRRASGLPVAANPVVGPLDVIGDSGAGVLDANLGRAALAALSIPRELARTRALTFSLSESARQFIDNVFAAHWAAALDNVSSAVRDEEPHLVPVRDRGGLAARHDRHDPKDPKAVEEMQALVRAIYPTSE
jgi:hypothetical protein